MTGRSDVDDVQLRGTMPTLKVLAALRRGDQQHRIGDVNRITGLSAARVLRRLRAYGWVTSTLTDGHTLWELTATGRAGSAWLLQGRIVTLRAGCLEVR
jgi:hypothetical protein